MGRKLRTEDSDSTMDLVASGVRWTNRPFGCYKEKSDGSLNFNSYSATTSCSSSVPCLCRTSAFNSGAYAYATSACGTEERITSWQECQGAAMMLDSAQDEDILYGYDMRTKNDPKGCFVVKYS